MQLNAFVLAHEQVDYWLVFLLLTFIQPVFQKLEYVLASCRLHLNLENELEGRLGQVCWEEANLKGAQGRLSRDRD
jgi:hypothetical protein